MENENPRHTRVLLADSKAMERQLVVAALQHQGFEVFSCNGEIASTLDLIERNRPDVAVLSCAGSQTGLGDMGLLRALHLSDARVPTVFLMEADDRELVVQAFRLGARGILCLADSSFDSFCECIERVFRGGVWATARHLNYLLDSVCQVTGLRVMSVSGDRLLTSREEQVVALVADGLSNRHVAAELGLSEHTVKKYLFRIFDKLGISNRVELALYAMHNGAPQAADWASSA